MTLACSDKCLKSFREDDLTRSETTCLVNCYGKHYRFFAYANTLYSYIVSGEQVDGHIKENYEDFIGMDEEEANEKPPLSKVEGSVISMAN